MQNKNQMDNETKEIVNVASKILKKHKKAFEVLGE